MTNLVLHISGSQIRSIYDERLDLRCLGNASIRRASHVEPDEQGTSTDAAPTDESPTRHSARVIAMKNFKATLIEKGIL